MLKMKRSYVLTFILLVCQLVMQVNICLSYDVIASRQTLSSPPASDKKLIPLAEAKVAEAVAAESELKALVPVSAPQGLVETGGVAERVGTLLGSVPVLRRAVVRQTLLGAVHLHTPASLKPTPDLSVEAILSELLTKKRMPAFHSFTYAATAMNEIEGKLQALTEEDMPRDLRGSLTLIDKLEAGDAAGKMEAWYQGFSGLREIDAVRQVLRKSLDGNVQAYADAITAYAKENKLHGETLNLLQLMVQNPAMFRIRRQLGLAHLRLRKEGIDLDIEREYEAIRKRFGKKPSMEEVAGYLDTRIEQAVQVKLRSVASEHDELLSKLKIDGRHDVKQEAKFLVEKRGLGFTGIKDSGGLHGIGSGKYTEIDGLDEQQNSAIAIHSEITRQKILGRVDDNQGEDEKTYQAYLGFFDRIHKKLWELETWGRKDANDYSHSEINIPALAQVSKDPFVLGSAFLGELDLKGTEDFDRIYNAHVRKAVLFFLKRRIFFDFAEKIRSEFSKKDAPYDLDLPLDSADRFLDVVRPQLTIVEEYLDSLTVEEIEKQIQADADTFYGELQEQLGLPNSRMNETIQLVMTGSLLAATAFLRENVSAPAVTRSLSRPEKADIPILFYTAT